MATIIQMVYNLVNSSEFKVVAVMRPRKDLFLRECTAWYMEVPPNFSLNDIAEVIGEMSETTPFIEDEFHHRGRFFVCTTKRTALRFALYGFMPYAYELIPVYQTWGAAA